MAGRATLLSILILLIGCAPYPNGMPSNCLKWAKEYVRRQNFHATDTQPSLPALAGLEWEENGQAIRHAVVVLVITDELVCFTDNGYLVTYPCDRLWWTREMFEARLVEWFTQEER